MVAPLDPGNLCLDLAILQSQCTEFTVGIRAV